MKARISSPVIRKRCLELLRQDQGTEEELTYRIISKRLQIPIHTIQALASKEGLQRLGAGNRQFRGMR